MATEAERAAAFFLNSWCDLTLHSALRPLVFLDVFNAAAEKDRAYFRSSREKGVGRSLEKLLRRPRLRADCFCSDARADRTDATELCVSGWRDGELFRLCAAWFIAMGSMRQRDCISAERLGPEPVV